MFFVNVADIDWIEAAGNYVKLHVGNDTHLFRETMNAVEARLDADMFFRIHRSHIVNIERIRELIDRQTDRSAAILGAPPRVNVLLLNRDLDDEKPTPSSAIVGAH